MAFWNRNKEKAVDPAVDQQKSKEAILNNAKFVESLDRRDDIDVDSDFETLNKAHEAFKIKEATSKELQVLFKNEIKRDLGINFDSIENKEIAAEIDRYLESELVDNPERIMELSAEIAQFNEFQKQIDAQKQIVEKLGTSLEILFSQEEVIAKVQGTKKWFQKIRSYSADHKFAREEAQNEHGIDLKDIKGQYQQVIEKLRAGTGAQDQVKDLQENFAELRKKILQDLAPMAALHELAQEKAKDKLQSLTDPSKKGNLSIQGIEKAKQLFDKMYGDSFHQETGIDYNAGGIDPYEFYTAINERLDDTFKQDAVEAIDKVKGSSLTLKKMSEVLKPLFGQKQLGDRSAAETKEFLLDYLNNELMPTLPKSKQILLSAAIGSFS